MNLENVMDELGAAARGITGLRVHPYEEEKVTPPAFLVGLPSNIKFDETYGRGMDSITLELTLLVSKTGGGRVQRSAIAPYADGSGIKSIKKALEKRTYTACDFVFVASARFDVVNVAGIAYLAVIFVVNIAGPGG